MIPFRERHPQRTYNGAQQNNYRKYREPLRQDFNRRCGYSDISEKYLFDTSIFHIDHFRPKAKDKFPHLKNEYYNLVYASCYVNRCKKDDWHGDETTSELNGKGYLDPCLVDYNEHFYRKGDGSIIPMDNSPVAKYMFKRLKLFLKRYSIFWMLEQFDNKLDEIEAEIDRLERQPEDSKDKIIPLKIIHSDLSRELRKHLKILHVSIYGR